MCEDSLLKDVLCVHPPVVLGQFDGEDDTGDEKDGAASQTKPEGVLENKEGQRASLPGTPGITHGVLQANINVCICLTGLIRRIHLVLG